MVCMGWCTLPPLFVHRLPYFDHSEYSMGCRNGENVLYFSNCFDLFLTWRKSFDPLAKRIRTDKEPNVAPI